MSDHDPSDKSNEQLPDLSALNFGPAWARDSGQSKKRSPARSRDSARRNDRGEKNGRGQKSHRGGDGRTGERREESRFHKGRKGSSRAGNESRRPMASPPKGITARVMPIEEGLDAIAKDIVATGRTHSVFDIAWTVLGSLERFYIIFESENQTIYRSKKDNSVWLEKKQCIEHLWSKGLVENYYEEEMIEVEPPKGNFQSVARCGLSKKLIAPPNHHDYQKRLLEIHREKFAHMDIERFKSKIMMEHSEDAVQEWVEEMKKRVRWIPKSQGEQSTEESSETSTEQKAPVVLNSHLEVEEHFSEHSFDDVFESGKTISVLASVPVKMIDPSLMVLVKNTVTEERRYPGKLASILCRQMSGRHLSVFKWKKHLHCGPARPKQVPDNMVMAERPSALFRWVIDNPGGEIDAMWKAVFPQDIDEETKLLWYHELHWLINEGIVLLFSDGKLHAAKELQKKTISPVAKKTKEKSSSDTASEES